MRHTWKHLARPARNGGMLRGIASAEHDYGAAAALASSGLLQRSSRDEDEGSAKRRKEHERRRHLFAAD